MQNVTILDISQNEMAQYLEKSFSNKDVQHFLNTAPNMSMMEQRFRYIGHYISAYATATGDLSQKAVSEIVKKIEAQNIPYTRDAKRTVLKEILGPMILKIHCKKMGISYPPPMEEMPRLFSIIYRQGLANCFETHSFNGALLDEIRTNGFDIKKEKFQREFQILEKYAGLYQPFQKGNLLFCDLNEATFGYALRAPERLRMTVNTLQNNQENTQTTHDFYSKALKNFVAFKGFVGPIREAILEAGQKIIDFYCLPEGNKSAIAVRKQPSQPQEYDPNDIGGEKYIEKSLFEDFYFARFDINRLFKKNNDFESLQRYQEACEDFKKNQNSDKLRLFVTEYCCKHPDKNPFLKIYNDFTDRWLRLSIPNYESGLADGRLISEGRLAPSEFSIAVLDNPIDEYVKHQKQKNQKETNKFSSAGKKGLRNIFHKLSQKAATLRAKLFEDSFLSSKK